MPAKCPEAITTNSTLLIARLRQIGSQERSQPVIADLCGKETGLIYYPASYITC
jgi:hypothetical protein